MLERADDQIAALLAERSGNSYEAVAAWMSGSLDGTTFTGSEAVDRGFADELIPMKSKATKKNPTQRQYYETAAMIHWARLKNRSVN